MTDVSIGAPESSSLVGALIAVVIAIVVGVGCYLVGVPEMVTNAVTPAAGTLSATVAYRLDRRRRDQRRDLERMRAGELRRPAALVAAMLGFGIFLFDSILGLIFWSALMEGSPVAILAVLLLLCAGAFGMSIFASHFLGEHPYVWTLVAVLGMLVVRIAIIVVVLLANDFADAILPIVGGLWAHMFTLAAALLGTLVGRQRQARFVQAKAEKLEHEIVSAGRDAVPSAAPPPSDGTVIISPVSDGPAQPPAVSAPTSLAEPPPDAGQRRLD